MDDTRYDGQAARIAPSIGDRHRSLNDLVTDALRDAILGGRFQPGERLVEDRIASLFGVSRNPVREALQSLKSEGLVELLPRRGATVSSLSPEEASEVIELRAALEGLGARLAARRCPPDLRDRMRDIVSTGEQAAERKDTAALRDLNDEFHALLAAAGANRYLEDFMRLLRRKTFWLFATTTEQRAIDSWHEHASILNAVLSEDEDMAELLASRHVTNVGAFYLREATHAAGAPEENTSAA